MKHITKVCKNMVLVFTLCSATVPPEKDPIDPKTVTPQEFDEIIYNTTRTFAHVMQLVKDKHFKMPDVQVSMNKAIDAFLGDLDPHSGFMDQKTYKLMLESTSGEFYGTGSMIDNTRKTKDKFLLIIDTIPGGPADTAGILPMDKIVEIDGKPLENMTTEEATSLLKGQRHTTVHIKIMRGNSQELLPFDIVRDVVKEQSSVSFFVKNQNICYVSLSIFSDNAAKQLKEILQNAAQKKYKAIILDLRNNSGGLLHAAVDICSFFVKKGSLVVTTKDKNGKIIEEYRTKNPPIAPKGTPIFVLINNYTASAAEILAGCLKIHSEQQKDQSLVFLVGGKTFGKGSVQELIPLDNNCAVKLTTSLYYLPNDVTIQATGIVPDFSIVRTSPPTEQVVWFTKFYGHEDAFENHIRTEASKTIARTNKAQEEEKEKEKKNLAKTSINRAKQLFETDNQIRETIGLINTFAAAHASSPEKVNTREKAIEFMKHNHITNDKLELEEIK